MTLTQFPAASRFDSERNYNRFLKNRPDAAIEEEIWGLICKDRSLGPRYEDNLSIEVEEGRVRFTGHILEPWHSHLLVSIANRVDGVVLVSNELVADQILRDLVVQALLENETTSPYILTVKCRFGWISLGGLVSSHEIAKTAEGVAGSVAAVRGVLSLPAVFGSAWQAAGDDQATRRTLQPRLAATVYQDGDGPTPVAVGLVSQVLVDPCSRLVSAVSVRVQPKDSDGRGVNERLVPITAIEASNTKGVWLKEGQSVHEHGFYDRRQFPLPPLNWRPPFPYQREDVRWSLSISHNNE